MLFVITENTRRHVIRSRLGRLANKITSAEKRRGRVVLLTVNARHFGRCCHLAMTSGARHRMARQLLPWPASVVVYRNLPAAFRLVFDQSLLSVGGTMRRADRYAARWLQQLNDHTDRKPRQVLILLKIRRRRMTQAARCTASRSAAYVWQAVLFEISNFADCEWC